MSKNLSLYMLLGTVVTIGILFYQVIQPFIFYLLFAAVLSVVFRPVYHWVTSRLIHHPRIAAASTTIAILTLIILPLGGALVAAGMQLFDVSHEVVNALNTPAQSELSDDIRQIQHSPIAQRFTRMYEDLSPEQQARLEEIVQQAANGFAKRIYERTVGLIGDVLTFTIGLIVTGLAVYYFLADGDAILQEIQELSPMDDADEIALFEQFGKVCRGVVTGTVLAALVQAILAGIGYGIAGLPNGLLLAAVTMTCAFIPFVGAGSVVTLVAVWLAIEQQYLAALLLFLYGVFVVAMIDNLIRAYVIGSETQMNPLVAFITVVGALQLIGLWGIFVGPMIAALFYTLLKLLREHITIERRNENVNNGLAATKK